MNPGNQLIQFNFMHPRLMQSRLSARESYMAEKGDERKKCNLENIWWCRCRNGFIFLQKQKNCCCSAKRFVKAWGEKSEWRWCFWNSQQEVKTLICAARKVSGRNQAVCILFHQENRSSLHPQGRKLTSPFLLSWLSLKLWWWWWKNQFCTDSKI